MDKNFKFPDCYSTCAIVKMLGVGECESICPRKFDKEGNPCPHEPDSTDDCMDTGCSSYHHCHRR